MLRGLGTLGDWSNFWDSVTNTATDVWNRFDVNQFINTAANAYATVEKSRLPQPGSIRTLPDGSTARVNADGSLTVIGRSGQAQTIGASGQIFQGTSAGMPTEVLLGGLALLALLLLLRR